MADEESVNIFMSGVKLKNALGCSCQVGCCDVLEEDFPCIEKCYAKIESISVTAYRYNCPYCNLWTSLPDGENLEITYIFDCSLLGYRKRLKV